MKVADSKTFTFESSHKLRLHPGKCRRLHGHSWVLTVTVYGKIDTSTGFVMDYGDIKTAVDPLIQRLDHRHFGTWSRLHQPEDDEAVPGMPLDFYPSSENLIVWIADELMLTLPCWSELQLNETCTSSCVLTREDYEQGKTESKANS